MIEQANQTAPTPTTGRIVHYRLDENDVKVIQERRGTKENGHYGNPVAVGDVVPMIIVQPWGGQPGAAVNGQAFLDGNDSLWLTSRLCGEGPGTWTWPARN